MLPDYVLYEKNGNKYRFGEGELAQLSYEDARLLAELFDEFGVFPVFDNISLVRMVAARIDYNSLAYFYAVDGCYVLLQLQGKDERGEPLHYGSPHPIHKFDLSDPNCFDQIKNLILSEQP